MRDVNMESLEMRYLSKDGAWIDISIKVTPKSKRECVGRVVESGQGDRLEMWVHAPPVDGAANEAVEKLLAKTLKLPSSQCQVLRGHSSRYKTVRIPYNEDVYTRIVALWPIKRPQQTTLF